MAINRFWDSWENISHQERDFLDRLETLQELIDEVPEGVVLAHYAGGSFGRRELEPNSDLDTYVILANERDLSEAIRRGNELRDGVLNVHAYALSELESHAFSRIAPMGKDANRATPPRVVAYFIPEYTLVSGTPVDVNGPSVEDMLDNELRFIDSLLEMDWGNRDYKRLKLIAKTVFYIAHFNECLEEKRPFSRAALLESGDETLHFADDVRRNPREYLLIGEQILSVFRDYSNLLR